MNNEKQRIAIAEACGWKDVKVTNHEYVDVDSRSITYWSGLTGIPPEFIHYEQRIRVPDYLNDLNAMQSAENTLSVRDKQDYISILRNICTVAGCWPETATAAQRARAFLETLNLWENEK